MKSLKDVSFDWHRLRVPVDCNTYFSPQCLTLESGGSNVKGKYIYSNKDRRQQGLSSGVTSNSAPGFSWSITWTSTWVWNLTHARNVGKVLPNPPISLYTGEHTMDWNHTCAQSVERHLQLPLIWGSMLLSMTVMGQSIRYQSKLSQQLRLSLNQWLWNLSPAVTVTWDSLPWRSLQCTNEGIMVHSIHALIQDVWEFASLPRNWRNICWLILVKNLMGAPFARRNSPRRRMLHSTLQLFMQVPMTEPRVMYVPNVENVLSQEEFLPNTWCCTQTNDRINAQSVTKPLFRNPILQCTWTSTQATVHSTVQSVAKPSQRSNTWKITSSFTTTASLGWSATSVLLGNQLRSKLLLTNFHFQVQGSNRPSNSHENPHRGDSISLHPMWQEIQIWTQPGESQKDSLRPETFPLW